MKTGYRLIAQILISMGLIQAKFSSWVMKDPHATLRGGTTGAVNPPT